MSYQDHSGVDLTHAHSEAICTEVGERLGAILMPSSVRLPPNLLRLTQRLENNERGDPATHTMIGAR